MQPEPLPRWDGSVILRVSRTLTRSTLSAILLGSILGQVGLQRDNYSAFGQSVARAVGNFGSKLRTPFSHCSRISLFEASKAVCRSSDHWKGTLEDKRCLNGAMRGADANEYEIWFIHASRDR